MPSVILGSVAERLVPLLQTPVEDIIYEVLDQKGLPSRAEVRDLRNKLDRVEKAMEELRSALDGIKADLGELAKRPAAAAPVQAEADEPSEPVGDGQCGVPGCDAPVRARGFCAKHYQRWKRGTLDGFVNADGTTVHGEVRYRVDEGASGQIVETSYEGDEVVFFLPQSGGRTIRVKVNDARIDGG